MKIKGHSGCRIEICRSGAQTFVRKSAGRTDYRNRLLNQIKKQEAFYHSNRNSQVGTPKIIDKHTRPGICFIDMEFCNAADYVSYLMTACKKDIDLVVERILGIINANISQSSLTSVDKKIFLAKYKSITDNIKTNPLLKDSRNRFTMLMDPVMDMVPDVMTIPVGRCHGDLTLSNVLMSPRKLILIDFLDSFIETPIQDMVKVRQDTKFHWSTHFYEGNYDRVKLIIVMAYMDKKFDEYFKQFDFYRHYYGLFQWFNFARIIPYVKTASLVEYLLKTMTLLTKEVTHEFNHSCCR